MLFGKWSALPVPFLPATRVENNAVGIENDWKKGGGGKVGANNLGVIKAAEGKRSVCTMSRGGGGRRALELNRSPQHRVSLTLRLKRMGLRKGEGLLIPLKSMVQVRGGGVVGDSYLILST